MNIESCKDHWEFSNGDLGFDLEIRVRVSTFEDQLVFLDGGSPHLLSRIIKYQKFRVRLQMSL